MKDLWDYLRNTDKPVALYGTGDGADKIIAVMKDRGIDGKIRGIFASDGFVRERTFAGFKVESYSAVKSRLGEDMIVLMCFGSGRPEVLENVRRISSETEFYAPDVPVYGNNLFDERFYRENRDAIDEVTSLLADDLSVKTMRNTVTNKLTGDIRPLSECEVSRDVSDSLLKLDPGAVFVDLGAYNGDTVLRYTDLFPDMGKIYAVEPDKRNFRKLNENTRHLGERITCINALVSDRDGVAHTDPAKGRGVHETEKGKVSIPSVTIDGILGASPADFIKMDVEGNELAALRGGRDTIRRSRPVIQAACYHRSEDIFTIPLEVLSIDPDYRVYMRHNPHVPGWDTVFWFIPSS